jgi:predicted XRE-type DNA-binding protein
MISEGSERVKRKADYELSSGNVFADLGLPESEEALAKAELVQKIVAVMQGKGLTQVELAKMLGVDQPKVSALVRGRLSGFSLERLMRFLLLLGQDIKITVQASPRSRARLRVA